MTCGNFERRKGDYPDCLRDQVSNVATAQEDVCKKCSSRLCVLFLLVYMQTQELDRAIVKAIPCDRIAF